MRRRQILIALLSFAVLVGVAPRPAGADHDSRSVAPAGRGLVKGAVANPVQATVAATVKRWSNRLFTAYRHASPKAWLPPTFGVTQHGLQFVAIEFEGHSAGGMWILEDFFKRRAPAGAFLPDTSDSIAVRRIGSNKEVSYFAEVTADVDSVRDHAWAISIEDLDSLKCGARNTVSELFWCSLGPVMTTSSGATHGEKPITLSQWQLVAQQIQHEINAGLHLAPIHGPVLPNLTQQFFPESLG